MAQRDDEVYGCMHGPGCGCRCLLCNWPVHYGDRVYYPRVSCPVTETVYTTAPASYDYEWTVIASVEIQAQVSWNRGTRCVFRKLMLDTREAGYYSQYQQLRYQSGMYLVLNQEKWDREVAQGYIIPEESAILGEQTPGGTGDDRPGLHRDP